jgi:predicted ATP-dependent endonuclease of OLD family
LEAYSKSEIQKQQDENIQSAVRLVKDEQLLGQIRLKEFSSRNLLESQENEPCAYIGTKFISQESLSDDWDKIILTNHEEYVKTALKFIETNFEGIAFVQNDYENKDLSTFRQYFSRHSKKRFAKVKISGIDHPIPLNSMGDGMLRVLQLALKVYPAKGGFLLIDEFENGLHYTVQEKIWNWLFELASRFDFQVFATTHSWDCVESFSKIATTKKGEGVLFRVGRSVKTSDNGKAIATEFDEEKLAIITQADVEVR